MTADVDGNMSLYATVLRNSAYKGSERHVHVPQRRDPPWTLRRHADFGHRVTVYMVINANTVTSLRVAGLRLPRKVKVKERVKERRASPGRAALKAKGKQKRDLRVTTTTVPTSIVTLSQCMTMKNLSV